MQLFKRKMNFLQEERDDSMDEVFVENKENLLQILNSLKDDTVVIVKFEGGEADEHDS